VLPQRRCRISVKRRCRILVNPTSQGSHVEAAMPHGSHVEAAMPDGSHVKVAMQQATIQPIEISGGAACNSGQAAVPMRRTRGASMYAAAMPHACASWCKHVWCGDAAYI
jgi:hypothetical protein